jgi:hypothetical protein
MSTFQDPFGLIFLKITQSLKQKACKIFPFATEEKENPLNTLNELSLCAALFSQTFKQIQRFS